MSSSPDVERHKVMRQLFQAEVSLYEYEEQVKSQEKALSSLIRVRESYQDEVENLRKVLSEIETELGF